MQEIEIADVNIDQVRSLLESNALPTEDLDAGSLQLIGAFGRGVLIGCVGFERHGSQALLRSLAVEGGQRGSGVGTMLVEAALARACDGGMYEAYCVTIGAADFLSRFGFEAIDRTEVAGPVVNATELRGVCPDTATVLRRALEGPVNS